MCIRDRFKYSPDNGAKWFEFLIPEGSYEIKDINESIGNIMKQNKHYNNINDVAYISIKANTNTLRTIMTLENKYQVDFQLKNSLASVLGFESKVYPKNTNVSENIVNILSINSIRVDVSIITGSYVNGSKQPTIYSFFPNSIPGEKL